MKNIVKVFSLVFVAAIALNSCKVEIPYTKDVETKYSLEADKLRGLQFHLMGNVVLSKNSSNDNTELTDGDIVINEQNSMDKVIIREGTGGLYVKHLGDKKIAVSFEHSNDYFLVFGSTSEKGIYKLVVDKKNDKGQGIIKYNGENYFVSRSSLAAYITIEVKKNSQNSTKQRIAKGRKV